jgi:hypothetical protein
MVAFLALVVVMRIVLEAVVGRRRRRLRAT